MVIEAPAAHCRATGFLLPWRKASFTTGRIEDKVGTEAPQRSNCGKGGWPMRAKTVLYPLFYAAVFCAFALVFARVLFFDSYNPVSSCCACSRPWG